MQKLRSWLIPLLIIGLYLITHLYQLELLPVFADEAIYIRWTQLIIDDWQRYLFFPMMDGKTPLPFWLMVPFQFLFDSQLYAARFVNVLLGLVQVLSLGYLVKSLRGRKSAQWLAMAMTAFLPFWYFHHRMALTDGLLALGMTWAVIGVSRMILSQKRLRWGLFGAASIGFALWSKLPALLVLPTLPLFAFLQPIKKKRLLVNLAQIGLVVLSGLGLFYLLRLSDTFPRLFVRGSDFLYPWKEVVFGGAWKQTIISIPNYITYFGTYLTWPVLLLNVIGLFSRDKKAQRVHHVLFWSAVVFAGPIAVLGKVVYARYFFPIAIFLTANVALVTQDIIQTFLTNREFNWKNTLIGVVLALLLTNTGIASTEFMIHAVTSPEKMNLVSSDREQYLYRWSAGYGIPETIDLIEDLSQDQTLAVATEGSFGTLPDGLVLYFHRRDVSNLFIDGIGYPVSELKAEFIERAKEFDQTILVVNSNRLGFELPAEKFLTEFCRPDNMPCLQIWDVTHLVQGS